ncbi:MAG: hypothetical protein JNK63_02720 [Chthonomonas sp.]|nr:hypothetical protein [Chthonomonas sp.]
MATVRPNPLLTDLRGRLGNVVFVPQPNGIIQLREHVPARNPRSVAQMAWRDAMRLAGRAYQDLTQDEHAQWKAYVESLPTEQERALRTVNVFIKLSARFLLINPEGKIPRLPPKKEFLGDNLQISICETRSGVIFESCSSNSEDTMTELLVHKIASANNRTYDEKFRSKGFTSFQDSEFVELPAGWFVCACRYVRPSTGQFGAITEVGRVRVLGQS